MAPAKNPPPPRPCAVCGAPFTPQNARNTCCSPACVRERKRRACAAWYAENRDRQVSAVVERRRKKKRK